MCNIMHALDGKEASWSSRACFEEIPENPGHHRLSPGKRRVELSLQEILQYVMDFVMEGVRTASAPSKQSQFELSGKPCTLESQACRAFALYL
jgi:hypothetical protein